jgi:hypothetical protein
VRVFVRLPTISFFKYLKIGQGEIVELMPTLVEPMPTLVEPMPTLVEPMPTLVEPMPTLGETTSLTAFL